MTAFLRSRWLGIALFVAIVAYAGLRYDGFFSRYYLGSTVLGDSAPLGFAALGLTIVIMTGGIDLSVGAVAALASVLFAKLLLWTSLPLGVVVVAIVALGALFGAGQGALVRFLALPSFLVTLAGLFAARGLALIVEPETRASIVTEAASMIASWKWLDVPLVAFVMLAAYLAFGLFSSRTLLGRTMLAVGADAEAVRLMGLPASRAIVGAYAMSGACAACAGCAMALATSAGDAMMLQGLELDAIAAAAIGGASLAGGRGSVCGTLLGVLTLALIQAVITFDGTLNSWWAKIATGALLLLFAAGRRR